MKKYHKDYHPSQTGSRTEEKEYEYTGEYYLLEIEYGQTKKRFAGHLLFTGIQLMLLIFAGLLNNDGSRIFFIAVPYAFLYFPHVYLVMAVFAFRNITPKMQRVVYDKAIGRLGRCLNGILFLAFYLTAADLIYIIAGMEKADKAPELIFLFLMAGMAAVACFHRKYLYIWKKKVMICK